MPVACVPERLMPLVKVPVVFWICKPLVRVPVALFSLMSKPLVLVTAPVRLTSRASAAPAWLTISAVAAVPLVPLTVRPTTLAAVGWTVFWPVVVGTSAKQDGHPATVVCHVGNAL